MLGKLVRNATTVRHSPASLLPSEFPTMSINSYLEQFRFNDNLYQFFSDEGNVEAGRINAVVTSALTIRGQVLSEAVPQWEDLTSPLDETDSAGFGYGAGLSAGERRFFDTAATLDLHRPFPGGTIATMLGQMDFDASFWGNSYWVREQDRSYTWLDPCKVTVAYAPRVSPAGVTYGKHVVAYLFSDDQGEQAVFLPEEVVHYKPLQGQSLCVGRSWVAGVYEDLLADNGLTRYKTAHVNNAATPRLAVTFKPEIDDPDLEAVVEAINARHQGSSQAFRTIALAGGADIKVLGSNLRDLDVKQVQGAMESRIAAASGVPATLLGISEGLQGSSLNSGNYASARRRFADATLRPLWREVMQSIEPTLPRPRQNRPCRLWYDTSKIEFLQEDEKDAVDVMQTKVAMVNALIQAGWENDAAVRAVGTMDIYTLHGKHTGLQSVQLIPPNEAGTNGADSDDDDTDDGDDVSE